jgi:hypothetical protein
MKSYRILGCSFALAAAVAICSVPAHAQLAEAAAASVASSLVTKAIDVVKKPIPAGTGWLKAEVIRADSYTIIVREQGNGLMIHTFTFGPEIKVRMQTILDRGGYQYGDKVSILCAPGQNVALRISGKPSKPQ